MAAWVIPAITAVSSFLAARGSKGNSTSFHPAFGAFMGSAGGYANSILNAGGYSGYRGNMNIGASPLESAIFGQAQQYGMSGMSDIMGFLNQMASGKGMVDITKNIDEMAQWNEQQASSAVRQRAGVAGNVASSSLLRDIAGTVGNVRNQAAVQKGQMQMQGQQLALQAGQVRQMFADYWGKLAAVGAQQRSIDEGNLSRKMQDYYWRTQATNQLIQAMMGGAQTTGSSGGLSTSGALGAGVMAGLGAYNQSNMWDALMKSRDTQTAPTLSTAAGNINLGSANLGSGYPVSSGYLPNFSLGNYTIGQPPR